MGRDYIERRQQYPPATRRGDVPPSPPPPAYRVRRVRPETPAAEQGIVGAADHWQNSLDGMQRTAELVHAKCTAELAAAQARAVPLVARTPQKWISDPAAVQDTLALRHAVNASFVSQMEFFTACVQAWAGPPRYS